MPITHVAFLTHDGNVYKLPPPNRHHNVIAFMGSIGYSVDDICDCVQGFMLDNDEFVDREVAWRVANDCGQIIRDFSCMPNTLFSEHIW